MAITPRLAMSYLVASQAQKEVTHNDALNDIDFIVHLSVISRSLTTPPSAPATGDTYLLPASSTGAWSGYGGNVASYYSGWKFKTPKAGWRLWSQSDNKSYLYDGTSWQPFGALYLEGTLSWTPGTLAAGAGATSTALTITGVSLGDFVQLAAPYDLQGVTATAYVNAANSVVLRVQNGTTASVTLGAGTWRARVSKQ